MNRKEIEAWLYDSDYLFKEATKDIQIICGTKQYHVELLEAFQSSLLKALNSKYKSATPQCPHFFRGTDGVHACIVEQCNHPDKEKW